VVRSKTRAEGTPEISQTQSVWSGIAAKENPS